MQSDGNLVVYAPGNRVVWAADPCSSSNGFLLCGPIRTKHAGQPALGKPLDNAGSARTIERNGGVLEGIRHFEGFSVRRYRITLNQ